MLETLGCSTTIVSNGLAAVAAAAGERWDIILMDGDMPELDGVEATRRIRLHERSSDRPRVAIVAVTAINAHYYGQNGRAILFLISLVCKTFPVLSE